MDYCQYSIIQKPSMTMIQTVKSHEILKKVFTSLSPVSDRLLATLDPTDDTRVRLYLKTENRWYYFGFGTKKIAHTWLHKLINVRGKACRVCLADAKLLKCGRCLKVWYCSTGNSFLLVSPYLKQITRKKIGPHIRQFVNQYPQVCLPSIFFP